jgi:hypothetical protein
MQVQRLALTFLLFAGAACSPGITGTQDPALAWMSSVSLSATPLSIAPGDAAQLTAHFVAGSGAVTPNIGVVTSDAAVAVHPTTTTIYSLTVTSAGSSVSKSVTVTVASPAPSSTIIYSDALAANWQDKSWCTHDLANTSPVSASL